jgi:mono/diheme cytochrome c family protein
MSRKWLIAAAVGVVALLFILGPRGRASSRPPIHVNPNMDVQPRAEPQGASDFFYDGAAMRAPVPNTVARGELRDLRERAAYWTGQDAEGNYVETIPVTLDDAMRERGMRRYEIYCAVCHDKGGDGKGLLFERGKVPTPSLHDPRLVAAPDGHFFDVITNGFGLMPSYKYPIPVDDRWAIIAHVRTLQERRAAGSQAVAP